MSLAVRLLKMNSSKTFREQTKKSMLHCTKKMFGYLFLAGLITSGTVGSVPIQNRKPLPPVDIQFDSTAFKSQDVLVVSFELFRRSELGTPLSISASAPIFQGPTPLASSFPADRPAIRSQLLLEPNKDNLISLFAKQAHATGEAFSLKVSDNRQGLPSGLVLDDDSPFEFSVKPIGEAIRDGIVGFSKVRLVTPSGQPFAPGGIEGMPSIRVFSRGNLTISQSTEAIRAKPHALGSQPVRFLMLNGTEGEIVCEATGRDDATKVVYHRRKSAFFAVGVGTAYMSTASMDSAELLRANGEFAAGRISREEYEATVEKLNSGGADVQIKRNPPKDG